MQVSFTITENTEAQLSILHIFEDGLPVHTRAFTGSDTVNDALSEAYEYLGFVHPQHKLSMQHYVYESENPVLA